MVAKGYSVPEVEAVYSRARELCRQVGETPQLFPVLHGLCRFYVTRGESQTGYELGEQLLSLAQSVQDPALLLEAYQALGLTLFCLGEFVPAREHLERGIALYDPQQYHFLAFPYGLDPGVACLFLTVQTLWFLGYPDQALKRSQEALPLARELAHSYSLAWALEFDTWFHHLRREEQLTRERAEAVIALSSEQGFPFVLAVGTIWRSWALAEQGQEEGIAQMHQGLAAFRATRAEVRWPSLLTLLAEAYRKAGQVEEGLTTLDAALAAVNKSGERFYEAELYRLKGQLTLQKFQVSGSKFQVQESPKSEVRGPESEAEECFHKAIEIARRQSAKSLELRAVMSLSRLWRQQGKKEAAHKMLPRSTAGLLRGLIRRTCKRRKCCWRSWESRAVRDDRCLSEFWDVYGRRFGYASMW
jgi:predicted ATPase